MGRSSKPVSDVKASAPPPAQPTVHDRRQAMPIVAAFVDACRAQFGAAMVDRQLAIAQQARREHAQILASQGAQAAARWLRANAHRCTFYGEEDGRTVGLQPPWGRDVQAIASIPPAKA